MSEIKLLPCPFCGGEARLMCIEETGEEYCINDEDELETDCSFVRCYNCDIEFIPDKETAREVLEAWNTRKPMQEIGDELYEAKSWHEQGTLNMTMIAKGIDIAIEIVKEVGGMNGSKN